MNEPLDCPECGLKARSSVQGPWGWDDFDPLTGRKTRTSWQLFEGYCPQGHYWAWDLRSNQRLFGLGYRLDRATGYRKQNARIPGGWRPEQWTHKDGNSIFRDRWVYNPNSDPKYSDRGYTAE